MIEELKNKIVSKSLELAFTARSGVYYLESNPLFYIDQWIRFKKFQKPEQILSEKELLGEVRGLIAEDVKSFIKYKYPLSLFNAESPLKHVKSLLQVYLDSINVAYSKKFQKNKFFSEEARVKMNKLPDYYTRNFHNQTDGYLSKESAEMYDHQVEILFRGTADAMRRLILEPIVSYFQRKESIKILEVGAGTGVSTKILSRVFQNADIKAYDLSPDYTAYAAENCSFDNTSYHTGNAEDLSGEQNETVDLWVSTFMFHELPHEARIEVLKEAYRVLKPGGRIVIVDSIQKHDRKDFEEVMTSFPQNFHEPYYKNYTQKPLEVDIESVGFNHIESKNRFLSKVCWAVK
ncbi:MAG: class I SAM-dependent methyltransferase [Bdellovibrionales bacterium]